MLAGAALLLVFEGWGRGLAGVRRELAAACYEDLLKLYMPGLWYEETGSGDMAAYLLDAFFPVGGGEKKEQESYPTQVESELSYEMILAREAADENYVDEETGKVVIVGEEQADAAASDMPEAGGTKEADAAADSEAGEGGSADAQAEEETPVQGDSAAGTGLLAAVGTGEKVNVYSREKLRDFDFLVQNFYQIDSTTTIDGSQLNVDALLGKDVRLSHDASTPQILIYHTHSQEGYADSVPGDAGTTVVGVGDYLAKLLTERYGMNVIHHKGEYDVGDRDHAYSNAAPAVEQILAENPSIEVVIDLHRDGVRENTRLVTEMGGTRMAQIMFFNGLSRTTRTGDIDYLYNPYIADNLAISFQMQLAASEYYPGFTRRIYLKGYRYNMHYCPKTLLIEVGAQTNTVEEAMNAMVPLADLLNRVLTGPQ